MSRTEMKHLHVDFNTLTSAPVGLVKYLQEDGQPQFQESERVVLYDADGLEVEAVVETYVTATGKQIFVAVPDEATWRDTAPQEPPAATG